MLPSQNETREVSGRSKGGEQASGKSRCLICASPKFEICVRDFSIARRKFGIVSDEEWEFLSEHVRATIDLVSGIGLDRIPDDRFRFMVLGNILETSSDRYEEYVETYESKRAWRILDTSLW